MSTRPHTRPDTGDHEARPVAPLLVVVETDTDITEVLPDAVGRARAERRALVLVVVQPAHPWTTDAVVHMLHAERNARFSSDVLEPALARCADIPVHLVTVRRPTTFTTRGQRKALSCRIDDIALRCGAERHPQRRACWSSRWPPTPWAGRWPGSTMPSTGSTSS